MPVSFTYFFTGVLISTNETPLTMKYIRKSEDIYMIMMSTAKSIALITTYSM